MTCPCPAPSVARTPEPVVPYECGGCWQHPDSRDRCLLERKSAVTHTAALQETIDGARARRVAVLIEGHLNLLLKSPFDGLRRGSRPTVLECNDRHAHADRIALAN